MQQIPPPPEASKEPDQYTQKSPGFTQGDGPGQVFHFSCKWVSYGTDDKAYAASFVLSIFLIFAAFGSKRTKLQKWS